MIRRLPDPRSRIQAPSYNHPSGDRQHPVLSGPPASDPASRWARIATSLLGPDARVGASGDTLWFDARGFAAKMRHATLEAGISPNGPRVLEVEALTPRQLPALETLADELGATQLRVLRPPPEVYRVLDAAGFKQLGWGMLWSTSTRGATGEVLACLGKAGLAVSIERCRFGRAALRGAAFEADLLVRPDAAPIVTLLDGAPGSGTLNRVVATLHRHGAVAIRYPDAPDRWPLALKELVSDALSSHLAREFTVTPIPGEPGNLSFATVSKDRWHAQVDVRVDGEGWLTLAASDSLLALSWVRHQLRVAAAAVGGQQALVVHRRSGAMADDCSATEMANVARAVRFASRLPELSGVSLQIDETCSVSLQGPGWSAGVTPNPVPGESSVSALQGSYDSSVEGAWESLTQAASALGAKRFTGRPNVPKLVAQLEAAEPSPVQLARRLGNLVLLPVKVYNRPTPEDLYRLTRALERFDAVSQGRRPDSIQRIFLVDAAGGGWRESVGLQNLGFGALGKGSILLVRGSDYDRILPHEGAHNIRQQGGFPVSPEVPFGRGDLTYLANLLYIAGPRPQNEAEERIAVDEDTAFSYQQLAVDLEEVVADPIRHLYGSSRADNLRYLLKTERGLELPGDSPADPRSLGAMVAAAFPILPEPQEASRFNFQRWNGNLRPPEGHLWGDDGGR